MTTSDHIDQQDTDANINSDETAERLCNKNSVSHDIM